MTIEYHPKAVAELEEVRKFYNDRSFGLGDDFVNEVERRVVQIAAMPTRWMIVRNEVRRALMKRFPYVLYFRLIGERTIRVTVIKHDKRHPAFGLTRE